MHYVVQVPLDVWYINYPAYQISPALNTVISFHYISVFLLLAVKKLQSVFCSAYSILEKVYLCFCTRNMLKTDDQVPWNFELACPPVL